MQIVVDARFLDAENLVGSISFIRDVFLELPNTNPQNNFILLVSLKQEITNLPTNTVVERLNTEATSNFLIKWFNDLKLNNILKRNKASVFISSSSISFSTKTPQIFIVNKFPDKKSIAVFNNNFFKKSLIKSSVIATISENLKLRIKDYSGVDAPKIFNIGLAAKEIFRPVDWDAREQIKDKYSAGSEYFLFAGGFEKRNNLLMLLKAFSLFKQRQRTSMKLIITGCLEPDQDKIATKLKTYKLRKEVIVLGELPQQDYAEVLSGAYAFVYPNIKSNSAITILEAFASGVPVVASDNAVTQELSGSAALYFDPLNPENIAEQLKIIFKDEQLRSEMIQQAKLKTETYNLKKSAALLTAAIEQATSK